MKKYIYADNAATTQLDVGAFEAMKPYLLEIYGNASQPYAFARAGKKALKEARTIIAKCINAKPNEIYFTSGGTESDNWAIKGTYLSNLNKEIITSKIEHHAILNSVNFVKKIGGNVIYLSPDDKGVITKEELKKYITDKTGLVSIMYGNNEIGTIQPIKELTEVTHKQGCLFHTDAVQAVGHVNIDVKELGIDMLSASAHKFNGPKGIGFLYLKEGVYIDSYMDGGSQESSLRAGTENIASIVGMAYALNKNCAELEKNKTHIINLENELINIIKKAGIEFIRNGSERTLPGVISLSFKNQNGESLLHRLDLKGISVSTGSACDSVNTRISHVLDSIKLDYEYAKGTIRISLGKNNTIEEVRTIANEIIRIVK